MKFLTNKEYCNQYIQNVNSLHNIYIDSNLGTKLYL